MLSRTIIRSTARASLLSLLWITLSVLPLARLVEQTTFAQTATGAISGSVTDALGAVVPGAKITLTNVSTNQSRDAVTSDTGYYSFQLLPPGQYRLIVEKAGFRRFQQDNLGLDVGIAVSVNVPLEVGTVTETTTVQADQQVLESQTSSLSEVIGTRTISELPVNGRNSYSFATLVPGVVAPTGFTQTAFDEYNDQFVSINGARPNASLFLLDGGINSEPFFNGPGFYPSIDMVHQYNVQTSNLSAEFSNTAGGVVNEVTKSGGNQFHGSAYEYFRNTDLEANDFFSNQIGLPRAPFRFNQYGASLGGPLKKDRMFFFFSYEGLHWIQAATTTVTVPTSAQMLGDFSTTYDSNGNLIPLYNPFSTRPDPNNPGHYIRDPFPGNKIPANLINPVATNLFPYFPSPTSGGTGPAGINNFISNSSALTSKNDYSGRVDQQISQNNKLFARASYSSTHDNRPDLYGTSPQHILANPIVGDDFLRENQNVIGFTSVLNPRMVLELNTSYVYYLLNRTPGGLGFDPRTLGIAQPNYAEVEATSQPCFPNINIENFTANVSLPNTGGGTTLGLQCSAIHFSDYVFQEYGNLTISQGRHTIKTGVSGGLASMRGTGFNSKAQPIFNFSTNFTQGPDPIADANTGNAFASFLLGTGSGVTDSGGPSKLLLHYWYIGAYLQDDWRVTQKLTLNLGLRYDYFTPLYEIVPSTDDWNFTAASPLQVPGLNLVGGIEFPGTSAVPSNTVWNANKGRLAPRTGFAYAMREDTVLRGGFGLSTAPIDGAGFNQPAMPGTGFQATTPWVGTLDGVTPLATMDNPWPNGYVFPTGNTLGLATELGQSVAGWDRTRPASYVEQWNLDLQQRLPKDILLDIAYTGNHGLHLYANTNIDQLPDRYLSLGGALNGQVANPFYPQISSGVLSGPTVAQSQLLLPYPQFAGVTIGNDSTWGASSYNALYLKVERRFANGFSVLGAYTWQKLMDNIPASVTGTAGGVSIQDGSGPQDWYNLKAERSLATFNTPQSLSMTGILELPFGRGKRFLNQSRAMDYAVGGWQLNGIGQLFDGTPLQVNTAVNTLYNNGGAQRANWNGLDPNPHGKISHRLNQYFNVSDFSIPAPFTYGNSPRTLGSLSAPGIANLDLSAIKTVAIHERWKAQFRIESFNLFNHPRFGAPDTQIGSSNFGVISSQSNLPRQLQLAVRLDF
jgi:hypothetical protein